MESVMQWGLAFIYTVQSVSGPVFDAAFKGITSLGAPDFFIVLLPFILWCVGYGNGTRLGVSFLLAAYVNEALKGLFGLPRPFELDGSVKRYDAEGYGFPSGHAQLAVVVWGIMAHQLRKRWAWVVAVVLMVLIGFSRIYLGVHFPSDVVAGWGVGAALLALYAVTERPVEVWLRRLALGGKLLLVVALPVALTLLYATDTTTTVMGVLAGLGLVITLYSPAVVFRGDGPIWQRVVRLLLGLAVLLLFRFGLKAVFAGEGEALYLITRFLRYAIMGVWVGLAPWLFVKLRLAPVE